MSRRAYNDKEEEACRQKGGGNMTMKIRATSCDYKDDIQQQGGGWCVTIKRRKTACDNKYEEDTR